MKCIRCPSCRDGFAMAVTVNKRIPSALNSTICFLCLCFFCPLPRKEDQ
jgi:hypothetical protein